MLTIGEMGIFWVPCLHRLCRGKHERGDRFSECRKFSIITGGIEIGSGSTVYMLAPKAVPAWHPV